MKYRGADGWLYDDSVQKPQRMQKEEKLDQPAPPKSPEATYDRCPNCDYTFGWRQLEQKCMACGWKAKQKEKEDDGPDGAACAMILAIVMVPTPVFSGIGMIFFGFGGLVAGLGLGLLTTLGILGAAMVAAAKENKPRS